MVYRVVVEHLVFENDVYRFGAKFEDTGRNDSIGSRIRKKVGFDPAMNVFDNYYATLPMCVRM